MLAVVSACDAYAAESASAQRVSEQDFLSEIPIVLSVSRLAQPIAEAPGAITVIDRDMIRASGARNIPDLFRLVPGFYVGYDSGHTQTVTYHGLADQYAKRMQVLVDGRSVYTPLFGGVEWADLPLAMEDIERIEVIRGPNAATYGANSFLGIISIITRHASQDKGTYVSVTSGNTGIADGLLRYTGAQGDLDYRLSLGYQKDDGFDARNDTKHVRMLMLRSDYRLNNQDTLQFQFGYNGGDRGQGYFPRLDDPQREQAILSHFQQVRWQRTVAADEELSVQYYHNYHRAFEPYVARYTGLPPIPVDYGVTAERHNVELQHTFSPAQGWRMVWGGEARQDEVAADIYFGTRALQKSRFLRMFGNAEWRINPDWLLNAGAMWEKNDLTGTDISPRIMLNYHITPHHTLRAGVSKALRTPTLIEEKADYKLSVPRLITDQLYLSSGGLRPESIVSRELGYIGEMPALNLFLDVKLFRDDIRDLISTVTRYDVPPPDFNGKATDFRNLDAVRITGAEMQAKYHPLPDTQIIFNLARVFIHNDNPLIEYATSMPNTSLSVLAMHQFPGSIYGSLGYYQMGQMEAPGNGDTLGLQRRMDLRLAHRFRYADMHGELALVLQNVLDEYKEFRRDNNFDTRGFVNLNLGF